MSKSKLTFGYICALGFLVEGFVFGCVLRGGVFGGCPGGKSGEGVGGGGASVFGLLGFFE